MEIRAGVVGRFEKGAAFRKDFLTLQRVSGPYTTWEVITGYGMD